MNSCLDARVVPEDDSPLPDIRGPQREIVLGIGAGVVLSLFFWLHQVGAHLHTPGAREFTGHAQLAMVASLGLTAALAAYRDRLVWERIAPLAAFLGAVVGFGHRMLEVAVGEALLGFEAWNPEGGAKALVFVLMLTYGVAVLFGGTLGHALRPARE